MKRRRLYLLLGVEFIALTVLTALTAGGSGLVTSVMAFPLEQVGEGLRALSLAGRVGNGLALALWAALSLLPLLGVRKHWGDKSRRWENLALCCLTMLLLCVLPGMVNSGRLCAALSCTEDIVKMLLGGTVWSVAVLWAVLRLLRLFRAGDTQTLLVYLRRMLYVLCVLFTGAAALACGGELTALQDLQRSTDGLLAVLRFLLDALPYGLDIAVIVSAMPLLDALLSDDPSGAPAAAEKLSGLCVVSLGVVAAAVAGMNVVQLALARWRLSSNVSVSVTIPVMSIAFLLAALLVSRLIAENRRLRDDNDLFI